MACRVWPLAALAALLLSLAGCSTVEQRPQRAAWRAQAEKACIASHRLTLSRYLQPRGRAIDGPGQCGLTEPFLVGALASDTVQLDTAATLDCSMIVALDEWVEKVVEPVAKARFGQGVAGIDTMGSYSCRGMNGQAGASISEHAFGNALDIGGFRLADGRRVTVVRDWTRGDEQSQAFLRDVHAGACESFTTVLGPGSNAFHYNHIHVDLAQHGRSSRHICRPAPDASRPGPSPDAQPAEEEQDVASAPLPPQRGSVGLVAGTPPAYQEASRPSRTYAASPAGRADGTPNDWDVTSSIPKR